MWFRPFYHGPLKHLYRLLREPSYRQACSAQFRYGRIAPGKETRVSVGKFQLTVPDAPSFLSAHQALLLEGIYDFNTDNPTPYILDVGANVGVSVLHFKQQFPSARVVAFEADPIIFRYLQQNVAANNLQNVELVPKAVWTSEGSVSFHPDGADGGRIDSPASPGRVTVESTRLAPWLENGKVDFLKLDIEGAEVDVIADCRDLLGNVKNMYIEYHSLVGARQRLGEMLDVCEKAGFRVYVDSVNRLRTPFLTMPVHSGMDVQLHVYCRRN
jgi:FkbM family methyltransferase